jgi:hypothetical protein
MDFSKLTDRERLIAEQAVETLRALDRAADDAPQGQGLARMEACIGDQGWGLMRSIMAAAAGARPEAQKRGPASGGARAAAGDAKFKACQPRTVLSTVGHIAFDRRRYHCPACKSGAVPLDEWAGVGERSITAGARRMLALAGTSWSFDRASAHLGEFCHLAVSDDTIERVCQEEGERARRWMAQSTEPVEAFHAAAGAAEFGSDGVAVNTVGGWREMRLSTLAKREPGAPCRPEAWDRRALGAPTVRLSTCAIADADHVGAGWARLSRRMNLAGEAVVNVIADGAKWIWEQAARRLPGHNGRWCVDVYHVSQHLHRCGRELLGDGPTARAWAGERLMTALRHNGPALIARIDSEASRERQGSARRAALDELLTYLRPNRDRMWYRDRLACGDAIGSGMIEGGCKNTIGARLKLNNARWRVRRAERIGMLRCVDASDQWCNFWKSVA